MTRCVHCDRAIFNGDTGLFHQEPVTYEHFDGTVVTFMDRITECSAGGPHEAPEGEDVANG